MKNWHSLSSLNFMLCRYVLILRHWLHCTIHNCCIPERERKNEEMKEIDKEMGKEREKGTDRERENTRETIDR